MGKKRISVPQIGAQERSWMGDIMELLKAGRTGVGAGAYQQNLLTPFFLEQAGLEAEYEDRSGRLQELLGERDKALTLQTQLKQAKGKDRRALLESLAGQEEFAGLVKGKLNQGQRMQKRLGVPITGAKPGQIKGGKLKKYLRGKVAGIEREQADIEASPLRIKGIKESAEAKAQTERERQLLKTQQEMLQKSLSMDSEDVLAADPALRRQLQEEQAMLEQAQVQQFGNLAGAQGGTVGAVQNAAMAQRRAEAVSNARRENIGLYAGLQTQQSAANQQRGAGRQAMGAMPGGMQMQAGQTFGNLAAGYNPLLQQMQAQRGLQYQANAFNQTQPSIGEKILMGIGSLLQPFKQQG
jgi:hypothetical protein